MLCIFCLFLPRVLCGCLDALALLYLLAREAAISILARLDAARGLVADAEPLNQILVALDIFSEEVVQETAALVDESNQASAGREVLGMCSEMFGEVGDALGHAGNLEFRGASVTVR